MHFSHTGINGKNLSNYANHINVPSVEDNMTVKTNENYSMRRIVIILLVCSPQHNCNYKNFVPGNSPKTVKEDSESKKNLEDRTHKQRLCFSNDCKKYNHLLENHPSYREDTMKGLIILQTNKRRQQIDGKMNDNTMQKNNHRKKKCFFKVFKLPGIKCITTVSKENVQKKSDDQDGGTSFTKFSTIR